MRETKNTARSVVRIGFDGRVHKYFRGPQAEERFENEIRVLEFLEGKGCDFVPKIMATEPEQLYLVTSNCGKRVERMGEQKLKEVFAELEGFGVRHDDAELRNITYRPQDGRFCVIDFEFSTILEPGYPPPPEIRSNPNLDNL